MDLSILKNKDVLLIFMNGFNHFAACINECVSDVHIKDVLAGKYRFAISPAKVINIQVEKAFILRLVEYSGLMEANPSFSAEDIAKHIAKEHLGCMSTSFTIDNSFYKSMFFDEAIDLCFEICKTVSVPDRIIEMIIEEVND